MHSQIDRIQPIERDLSQDERREGRGKKVLYQGREWMEADDEKPRYEPTIPSHALAAKSSRKGLGICPDSRLLENAEKMFSMLTTLEEKIAQLCFFQAQSNYDPNIQRETEKMIQVWQIGGILFAEGSYKRQAYLIEHFQKLSKTPLLIGNDFIHGLNLYFQHDRLINFEKNCSEQHYSDIGKALMVQNRRLGIHFQFDSEREKLTKMNTTQIRAFRKGIRSAQGIVGRSDGHVPFVVEKLKFKNPFAYKGQGSEREVESIVREAAGIKTLNFLDMSSQTEIDEQVLIAAFNKQYEIFLFSANLSLAIKILANAVRSGRISESEIDRRVMKLLIIKSRWIQPV